MTELERLAKRISRELSRGVEEEVRRFWREAHGWIYVRTYTVQAHVRKVRPRKSRAH